MSPQDFDKALQKNLSSNVALCELIETGIRTFKDEGLDFRLSDKARGSLKDLINKLGNDKVTAKELSRFIQGFIAGYYLGDKK